MHAASGQAVALLTNCDKNALEPAMITPLLEAWTGIKQAAPEPIPVGPIDPAPYAGVDENVGLRLEIVALNRANGARLAAKGLHYDYSLVGEQPAVPLTAVSSHVFTGRPGLLASVRFADPGGRPDAGVRHLRPSPQAPHRVSPFSAKIPPT